MAEEHRETGLAARYARAIFELAQEERAVETVERDFAALKTMIAESSDLARLVRSPVFSRDAQGKAMKAVLAAMGASALATRFVLLLAAKRRLFALRDIIRAYEAMAAKQRGEITASVVSARPLSDAQAAELKAMLKAKLGRDPRLEAKTDPAILGGLVVKVGSRMIDSSLRTKLNSLRAAMRGA